jgi:transcriptional regulator with XRE-family HTH domain
MKISKQVVDAGVLTELGQRIVQARLQRNLTQIGLAEQAGISKRTLERMEAGGSVQLSSFIRVCRALDLLDRLDALISEPAPSPIAQLKLRGKERKRASAAREPAATYGKWTWGDDT